MVDRSTHVRRRIGEKYNQDCLKRTVKHPVSVMIWSIISTHGPGAIYVVDGTMNSQQYCNEVISKHLIPQLRSWFPKSKNYIFMQDIAPCHTSKFTTEFLKRKCISVLPWPGNSPDLNPIENVWKMLKDKIATCHLTSKVELVNKIKDIWFHDTDVKRTIKNCTESMPRRIEAVINNKEDATKY